MQSRSLCCMPDPGLIYTGGIWLSQGVSGFAPVDEEKKPGLALLMFESSEFQSDLSLSEKGLMQATKLCPGVVTKEKDLKCTQCGHGIIE